MEGPSSEPADGGEAWRVFLGMGILAGAFMWIFWSVWMSVWMRHDLVPILTGPGAACGLLVGALFGGMMAIIMRPATLAFSIGDRNEFLSRLDGEMAKLRYRPLSGADGFRVYGPRTLVRPHAFDIAIRVEAGRATVAGPRANIRALKKRLDL
jgi:hypothetical protein